MFCLFFIYILCSTPNKGELVRYWVQVHGGSQRKSTSVGDREAVFVTSLVRKATNKHKAFLSSYAQVPSSTTVFWFRSDCHLVCLYDASVRDLLSCNAAGEKVVG